ncbi:MAG: FKBP-type peptidyl-prolyl cis-trans isomerase [Bacteroidales bacterium]|nr:FKBP-type peptidyl-prolyl cis-trans isomerase [Bacteroidales bacterium]
MKIIRALIVLAVCGLLCSCQEAVQKPDQTSSERQIRESLERANRYMVNDEEEDIGNYVRRHQLEMTSTGTGVRYQIVEEGKGSLIQPGQKVTIDYVLYDLVGDVVYSSEKDGLMEFVVSRSEVPSGLDEAVRLLREGDGAWVIVPSHLGYGILGDQNRVPSRATLIYYLKIEKVE